MKKIILVALLFSSCIHGINAYIFDGVEQSPSDDVKKNANLNKDLCGCLICIETRVWINSEIVYATYDHPDSIKKIRYHKVQADSLYNHIKKY